MDRRLQGLYSRECIVWSVAFLSNGTIVSSDSVGKVQFWDSEKGTLLETHPVSSSAVLCLAVSEVGGVWRLLGGPVRGLGRGVVTMWALRRDASNLGSHPLSAASSVTLADPERLGQEPSPPG